jgi:Holliday junction resolvasome RuvABC endonuclease subunit
VIVIAIDPGTKCGWAMAHPGNPMRHLHGVWNLSPGRHEGGGMRYVRLRRYLRELVDGMDEGIALFYEEVRGHKGTDAAQIYGGIVATVTEWCEAQGAPYAGIPVGTIKKHATGKGSANKAAMIAAAQKKFGPAVTDDNEADALWILDYAISELL